MTGLALCSFLNEISSRFLKSTHSRSDVETALGSRAFGSPSTQEQDQL